MEKDNLPQINDILKRFPHRYPFVLVDRILDFEEQKSITGLKNITYNEWYFQGLPRALMMVPALILCEAMAQLGAMLVFPEEEHRGKLVFFSGLDKVRFRKPVRPGDTLIIRAEMIKRRGRIGRLNVQGSVENKVAFEGIMQFILEDRSAQSE